MGADLNYPGRASLGSEAVYRFESHHLAAHGLDDAPAARSGAQGQGQGAGYLHPNWNNKSVQVAAGNQRHGNDSHCVLGVIAAVTERHKAGRYHLESAEVAVEDTGGAVGENV